MSAPGRLLVAVVAGEKGKEPGRERRGVGAEPPEGGGLRAEARLGGQPALAPREGKKCFGLPLGVKSTVKCGRSMLAGGCGGCHGACLVLTEGCW